jgi:hypothetical protein
MAGDVSIGVDLAVRTAATCGGVWFRFDTRLSQQGGYLVRFCPASTSVHRHVGNTEQEIRRWNRPAEDPGPAFTRVRLDVRGAELTVHRGDVEIGSTALPDPEMASGRTILGISVDAGVKAGGGPYEVAFRNVDVRSGGN